MSIRTKLSASRLPLPKPLDHGLPLLWMNFLNTPSSSTSQQRHLVPLGPPNTNSWLFHSSLALELIVSCADHLVKLDTLSLLAKGHSAQVAVKVNTSQTLVPATNIELERMDLCLLTVVWVQIHSYFLPQLWMSWLSSFNLHLHNHFFGLSLLLSSSSFNLFDSTSYSNTSCWWCSIGSPIIDSYLTMRSQLGQPPEITNYPPLHMINGIGLVNVDVSR